ncbi:MAG: PLP-dependent cysteine synthase family protein, partial [Desulfurococcaceae archaeon TW002]
MYRLVNLSVLECSKIDFNSFLKLSGDILRFGGVSKAIVIDRYNKVVKGNDLCDTLKRLGCVYAPVVVDEGSETLSKLVTLEELGFYEDIKPELMRVFSNTLELLYRNWPTPLVRLKSLSS